MKYTEFPVFPMVTFDRADSPLNSSARWKIIVSIPARKLKKPPLISKEAALYGVGEWLVIIWPKTETLSGQEATEITLYEASKGALPPNIEELGKARTRAIWGEEWASLIEVSLTTGSNKKRRHSGAIVEGANSIQVWLRL